MIWQAITCDICGSEKKLTNHWYVAVQQGGELRLTGWRVKKTLRSNVKHLCGQKCVHRLLDEFMAAAQAQEPAEPKPAEERAAEAAILAQVVAAAAVSADDSLSMDAPFEESARLIVKEDAEGSPKLVTPVLEARVVMTPPDTMGSVSAACAARHLAPLDLGARYSDAKWRAMVWQRQRDLLRQTGSPGQTLAGRARHLG